MALYEEIPDSFWSLFRSINRETYIDALLKINEEYEYNNYFLSREACIQVLNDHFSQKACWLRPEIDEQEQLNELEAAETESEGVRILRWLINTGWLKKLDDYATLTTNVIIPDYAAVFIESFTRLLNDVEDETNIYIQNIYAILFSVKNDSRAGANMLKTALINTKKLNHTLQNMLHNMDKFFGSLLEKNNYSELLREHLDGYVETIVKKKYHILKTSDNFYQFKNDIKHWLVEMEEDQQWIDDLSRLSEGEYTSEQIMDMLLAIERGFVDIEHRITNMDREHTRYIKATVTRLNYLLNGEDSMRGKILQILSRISVAEDMDSELEKVKGMMNLSYMTGLSQQSLYRKRKRKKIFSQQLEPDQQVRELSQEEILRLNRIHSKYTQDEIEEFVESYFDGDRAEINTDSITSGDDFEKLILAYNDAVKLKSRYALEDQEGDLELLDNGVYRYPKLVFIRRNEH